MATSTAGQLNAAVPQQQIAPAPSSNSAWTPSMAIYSCILVQDTVNLKIYASQRAVTPRIEQLMLWQLEWACGVRDSATYANLWYTGSFFLNQRSSWTDGQNLDFLRDNLQARLYIQAVDQAWADSLNVAPGPNGVIHGDPEVKLAILHRLVSNQQQIGIIRTCEADLSLAVLLQNGGIGHAQLTGQSPMPGLTVKTTAPPRPPLAPLVANAAPQGKQISRQAAAPGAENVRLHKPDLKRKREEPSRKVTEVVSLLDDSSEDEAALESKLSAIQSKIAGIQARTSHEDQLVPKKKAKSGPRPARANQTVLAAMPSISQRAPPIVQNPMDPAEGDFMLPPSSQNPNRLAREDKAGASLHAQSKAQNDGFGKTAADRGAVYGNAPSYPSDARHPLEAIATRARPLLVQQGSLTSSSPINSSSQPITLSSSPSTHLPSMSVPGEVRTEPVLCDEQQKVVDLIMAGHNVFYTGSAGCGKSTVLKTFVPKLREKGKTVRIVAPTGRAALDINGSTTWTFAGWTPGHFKKPLDELRQNAHGKFVSKRFRETDVLVIDEISMVENHMLARLDAVLRAGRGPKFSDKPFGGLQLIVTGDFCQLPPVKPFQYCIDCGKEQTQISLNGKTVYRCRTHGDRDDDDKWAFRSSAWENCRFKHVNLSQIHRQSDEVFIKILQKLRVGTALSDADRNLLLDHPCDVTNAVKLFSTRNQVKQINDTEFNRLTTAKHSYTCLDYFRWNPEHRNLQFKGARDQHDDSLLALRDHKLDSRVELKTGMLVVLLVNLDIDAGLVNGSQGRILGFERYLPSKLPKAAVRVESDSLGPIGASKKNSSSGRFASSQRRAREGSAERTVTVQGELRGEHASLREEQIREFLERPCNASKKWPLVEFDNGVRRTIFADCQVNELGDEQPYTLMARTQIPLIAAWAMTIHKSQGMTLNRVIVDLGSSFEEGQAYVALSRARSLEGLKVLSLGKEDDKGGNRQVKQFLWEKFGIR